MVICVLNNLKTQQNAKVTHTNKYILNVADIDVKTNPFCH